MNERHQRQLRDVAGWALRQYSGILTPTGRPKKPPTFYLMKCDDHGLSLSSSRIETKKRFTCQLIQYTPTKTKSTAAPHSVTCGKPATVIEEITEPRKEQT